MAGGTGLIMCTPAGRSDRGEIADDPTYQDEVEANALYDLLDQEVWCAVYHREGAAASVDYQNEGGDPAWCPFFNTARTVRDYAFAGLFPASDRYHSSV